MKIEKWIFLFILLSLAACSPASNERPFDPSLNPSACATPDDAQLNADLVVTVQDASLVPTDGASFEAWTYDGEVPGPVLRMNVGETLKIKLVNRSPRTASLHFHGVRYKPEDDGSPEHPKSMVGPGCSHIYTVTAVQPGAWPYHSHQDPRMEMARGLYGAIIVPDPNEAPADHEYVLFAGQLGLEEETEGKKEETFFMTFNGRAHGDAKVIELQNGKYVVTDKEMTNATVGDRVRWRVLNLSPDDPHTFHLHGHRWCNGAPANKDGGCPTGSLPTDNVDLLPAQGISLEYIEDNPGDWMYHCHIVDHVTDGMYAMYHVDP